MTYMSMEPTRFIHDHDHIRSQYECPSRPELTAFELRDVTMVTGVTARGTAHEFRIPAMPHRLLQTGFRGCSLSQSGAPSSTGCN